LAKGQKVMSSNEEVTKNVTVRVLSLLAGESAPWHFHKEVTDNMFCLSGELSVRLKNPDGEVRLELGQRCEVRPPRAHQVANMGSEEATYLLVQGVGQYDFNIVG
jgi:mannose-6-phosphate isomerase-like protein (cupin superfamily)